MNEKSALVLISRYTLIFIIALSHFWLASASLFYTVFTPLTILPVFYLLASMFKATLISASVIFVKGYYAQIISACIAGSAYFLLLVLNLMTPMPFMTRILNIAYLWFTFLVLNIFRIVLFTILLFKGYAYFDLAHIATWYVGSTLLVVAIWFFGVWAFHIKAIPIYTDLRSVVKSYTHHV